MGQLVTDPNQQIVAQTSTVETAPTLNNGGVNAAEVQQLAASSPVTAQELQALEQQIGRSISPTQQPGYIPVILRDETNPSSSPVTIGYVQGGFAVKTNEGNLVQIPLNQIDVARHNPIGTWEPEDAIVTAQYRLTDQDLAAAGVTRSQLQGGFGPDAQQFGAVYVTDSGHHSGGRIGLFPYAAPTPTPTPITVPPFQTPQEPNVPTTIPTDPLTVPSSLNLNNLILVDQSSISGRSVNENRDVTVNSAFSSFSDSRTLDNGVTIQTNGTTQTREVDEVFTRNTIAWNEQTQRFEALDSVSSETPYNGANFERSQTFTSSSSFANSSVTVDPTQTNVLSPGYSVSSSSLQVNNSNNALGGVLTPTGEITYANNNNSGVVSLLENGDVVDWRNPITESERQAIIQAGTFNNPATSVQTTLTLEVDPTIQTIDRRVVSYSSGTDSSTIIVSQRGVNGETLYSTDWNVQATRRTVNGTYETVPVPPVALQSNDVIKVGNVVLTAESGVLVSYDYEPAGASGLETLNAKAIVTQAQLASAVGQEQANALISQARPLQPIDITDSTPADIRMMDYDRNGNVSIEEQRHGRTGLFIVDAQGNHSWLPGEVERLPGAITTTADGRRVVTLTNGTQVYVDERVTSGSRETIDTETNIATAPTPTLRVQTEVNDSGGVGYSSLNPTPDVGLGTTQRTTRASFDIYGRAIFGPYGSPALQGVVQGNLAVSENGRTQVNILAQANTANVSAAPNNSHSDVQGEASIGIFGTQMLNNPEENETVPYLFGGAEAIFNAQATNVQLNDTATLSYGNQSFEVGRGTRVISNGENGTTDALNVVLGAGVINRQNFENGGDQTITASIGGRYTVLDLDGSVTDRPDSGGFGATFQTEYARNFNRNFGFSGGGVVTASFVNNQTDAQGNRIRPYVYGGVRVGMGSDPQLDPSQEIRNGGSVVNQQLNVNRIYARGVVFNQADPTAYNNVSRATELPYVTREVVAEVVETAPIPGSNVSYLVGYVSIPTDRLTNPTVDASGNPAGNVYEFRLPVTGQITDTHRQAFVQRINGFYENLDREINRTRTTNAAGAFDTSVALNQFGQSLQGQNVSGLTVQRLNAGQSIADRFNDQDILISVADENQQVQARIEQARVAWQRAITEVQNQYPNSLDSQRQALAQRVQSGQLPNVNLRQNNGVLVLYAANGQTLGIVSGDAAIATNWNPFIPDHTPNNPQQVLTNAQRNGINAQQGIAPNLVELGVTEDQAAGVIPSTYGNNTMFRVPVGTTPVEDGRVPLVDGRVIQVAPGSNYVAPQPPIVPLPNASSLGRANQIFQVAPPSPQEIRQQQEPIRPGVQGIDRSRNVK